MNIVLEVLVKHFLANCDVLRDLVSFVQFKKREKHPWRFVTCSKITSTKSNIPPWVFLPFGIFVLKCFNCSNCLLPLPFTHRHKIKAQKLEIYRNCEAKNTTK